MTDATSLTPQGPPQVEQSPAAEHGVFQSPSILFVLLRICIFTVLAIGISFALQWILATLSPGDRSPYSPINLAISEGSSLAGAVAAGVAMSRMERRSFGEYGLPARGAFGKLFWQGAFFGLLEISAVIGGIAVFGSYRFGSLAIHGADLLRWATFWAALFLMVGLYEEFAFRGYVQFTLAQAISFWPAAVLLSVAFGAVLLTHPGESKLGIAGVILTGLLWCFTLRRTGNLWFAVGMHASFDFGETFLYSVPDSGMVFQGHLSNATLAGPRWLTGGNTGPEASLCDFVMLIVLFYVFHRLYPARAQESLLNPSVSS